jgi:hypothetical protein
VLPGVLVDVLPRRLEIQELRVAELLVAARLIPQTDGRSFRDHGADGVDSRATHAAYGLSVTEGGGIGNDEPERGRRMKEVVPSFHVVAFRVCEVLLFDNTHHHKGQDVLFDVCVHHLPPPGQVAVFAGV